MVHRCVFAQGDRDFIVKTINELGPTVLDWQDNRGQTPYMLACKGDVVHIGVCLRMRASMIQCPDPCSHPLCLGLAWGWDCREALHLQRLRCQQA